MEHRDNNLDDILGLMDQLEGKVVAQGSVDSFSINEYKKIVNKFDEISININNRKLKSGQPSQSRLDELSDIMTSIANLDFTKRAYISKDNNHLDYLATGLNLIAFHLEKAIRPLLACRDFFEKDSQGVYIINEVGFLIYNNKLGRKLLGFSKDQSLPEDMSYLLGGLNRINDKPTEIELSFNDCDGVQRKFITSTKKISSSKGGVNYVIKTSIGKNLKKCDKMLEALTQIKSALEDKSNLELAEYFWLTQINKLLSD